MFCSQPHPQPSRGNPLTNPLRVVRCGAASLSSSDLGPCMRTCMRVGVYLYRFNNAFFGSLQLPNRLYRVLRRRIHKASAWSQCTVRKRGVEARRGPPADRPTIIEVAQILLRSPGRDCRDEPLYPGARVSNSARTEPWRMKQACFYQPAVQLEHSSDGASFVSGPDIFRRQ